MDVWQHLCKLYTWFGWIFQYILEEMDMRLINILINSTSFQKYPYLFCLYLSILVYWWYGIEEIVKIAIVKFLTYTASLKILKYLPHLRNK